MTGKGEMRLTTWMQLDDARISPAQLWDHFENGLAPVDIFINPTI